MKTKTHIYEMVLKGFNPESSDTDHLVKWVEAPSLQAVIQFMLKNRILLEYYPLQLRGKKDPGGIDATIDEYGQLISGSID